jgi:hypothetical protein
MTGGTGEGCYVSYSFLRIRSRLDLSSLLCGALLRLRLSSDSGLTHSGSSFTCFYSLLEDANEAPNSTVASLGNEKECPFFFIVGVTKEDGRR